MKYINQLCIALVALALSFQHSYAEADKKSENRSTDFQNVKYRKSAFQIIKYHLRPLGAMVKGKVPFDADKAKINADAVAILSRFPINGFQAKSLTEKSTALPIIWENKEKFEKEMLNFEKSAKNLSESTSSLETLKPAFLAISKNCKSCHKNYRNKK